MFLILILTTLIILLMVIFTSVFGNPKLIYIHSAFETGFFKSDEITNLSNVSLDDLDKIKYCKNLEELILINFSNQINYTNQDNVDFLDNPKLKILFLEGKYRNLSNLIKCPKLEELTISGCDRTKIFYKDESGYNSECDLNNLEFILELSRLSYLKLSVKGNLNLSGIGNLKKLESVYISAETIDCNNFADCTNIQYLALGAVNKNMEVKNSSALLKINTLKTVNISDHLYENGEPVSDSLRKELSDKGINVINELWY